MASLSPLCRWALAVVLVLIAAPAMAETLREIGESKAGKVYVDLDSIRTVGAFRIASVVTIYPEPSVNAHGFLMDRFAQMDAFDCPGRRGVGIRTIGYLNSKDVASSPELTGWQEKLKPLPEDPMTQNGFDLVCNGAAHAPGPQIAGLPIPAQPTPGQATPGSPPTGATHISSGSGVFVNAEGVVLTNAHVAAGCKALGVKALGVPAVQGTLEAVDPKNDLALVRTTARYGSPADFRAESRPARLGEDIGVIGYPLAGILSSEPKATFGQVNSVAGMNNDYTLLQISAPVQPGNSGGPVLDASGLVVGVVVSKASPALAAKVGIAPENVNFAIRGELAQIFMTAHGVRFNTDESGRRLRNDEIASIGERSTAQLLCVK